MNFKVITKKPQKALLKALDTLVSCGAMKSHFYQGAKSDWAFVVRMDRYGVISSRAAGANVLSKVYLTNGTPIFAVDPKHLTQKGFMEKDDKAVEVRLGMMCLAFFESDGHPVLYADVTELTKMAIGIYRANPEDLPLIVSSSNLAPKVAMAKAILSGHLDQKTLRGLRA